MIHDDVCHHESSFFADDSSAECPEVGFRQDSKSAGEETIILVLNPPPRRNMVQPQNWFYRAGATAIFGVAGGV